jgi:glycosyltransferase involved in cell wall biosynthesis
MVIVYVLTSLGMGGAERQVLALAERMADQGHAVKLLVLRPALKQQWPTALPVIHLDMRRTPGSVLKGIGRARRFLRGYRPDVIHSHSFHANMIARLLKLLVWQPLVLCTVHNVYEGGLHRMIAYRLTDFLSKRTTAVSTAAAERFVRLQAVPRRKCVVVTNGVDTAEFCPNAKCRAQMRAEMGVTTEFVWLAAGRMVPAKDFPNLLRAFKNVRTKCPDAQLWIAGEGNETGGSRVDAFSVEHGVLEEVREQVRWLGLRRDMPALMDACDGFVLASAWEGMPLVVGEAMAMEKPVVATDVGGVRELVGDAGVVVPAKDSDALAAGMLDVMQRADEDRAATGRAERARMVAKFSMAEKADEWEALYRGELTGR